MSRSRNVCRKVRRQKRKWGRYYYLLKYHHRRKSGGFDLDATFLDQLWQIQAGCCCYCECGIDENTRVLEHLTPLSRGGLTKKENVGWACWDCNFRKGIKGYDEFLGEFG